MCDLKRAVADYAKANELDPANGTNICNICVLYSIIEDYENALSCNQTCLGLKPGFFFALPGKGLVYHFTGYVANEKICIDRVKELRPVLKEGLKGYEAFKKEGGFFSRKNDSAMRDMFAR